jgi:hypothetical protein
MRLGGVSWPAKPDTYTVLSKLRIWCNLDAFATKKLSKGQDSPCVVPISEMDVRHLSLYSMAARGSGRMLKFLIENLGLWAEGRLLHVVHSPIHMASFYQKANCVKILLEAGVGANSVALYWA